MGVGWTGCNGHVKASVGYMMSGWLNAVKSAEYIAAVQANQYHGPNKVNGGAIGLRRLCVDTSKSSGKATASAA